MKPVRLNDFTLEEFLEYMKGSDVFSKRAEKELFYLLHDIQKQMDKPLEFDIFTLEMDFTIFPSYEEMVEEWGSDDINYRVIQGGEGQVIADLNPNA